MAVEAGHIQLTEYNKEVIPKLNYMLEDLFCRYGVSIPYYLLDFSFPDYQIKADWPAPYTPEWLELYRPKLPPWPEIPWWDIPDWKLPEMKWPPLPWVEWPRLPDMPWPEFPDWPEWDIPEWERPEFYWPEWDWPNWEEPEPLDKRKRRRRRKLIELITEVHKTKKISVGITLPKPPIEIKVGKPKWPLIQRPDWFEKTASDWPPDNNGFNFNIDQGEFGYDLPKLNELIGLLFDEADSPRLALPDLSRQSMAILSDEITAMYEAVEEVSVDYEITADSTANKGGKLDKQRPYNVAASWDAAWTEVSDSTPTVTTGSFIAVVMFKWQGKENAEKLFELDRLRLYFTFDTSILSGKEVTSAKIKFYTSQSGIAPTSESGFTEIAVYNQIFDTLDAGDWDAGTEVASLENSEIQDGDWTEFTLTSVDGINTEGETQFMVAYKTDGEETQPPDPLTHGNPSGWYGGGSWRFRLGTDGISPPILTITATG